MAAVERSHSPRPPREAAAEEVEVVAAVQGFHPAEEPAGAEAAQAAWGRIRRPMTAVEEVAAEAGYPPVGRPTSRPSSFVDPIS